MFKLWNQQDDGSFVLVQAFDLESDASAKAAELNLSGYRIELTTETGVSIVYETINAMAPS